MMDQFKKDEIFFAIVLVVCGIGLISCLFHF